MQPVTRSRRNISNFITTCSIAAVSYLLWDKNKYLTYTHELEAKNKDLAEKLDLALSRCEPMYMVEHTEETINIVNQQNLELRIQELQQQLVLIVANCESCIKNIDLSKEHLVEKQALKLQIKELNKQLESAVFDYNARIKTIDSALVGYDKQFDDLLLSSYQVISAIEQKLENFKWSLNNLDPANRKTSLDALSAHMKKLEILDKPSFTPMFSSQSSSEAKIDTSVTELGINNNQVEVVEQDSESEEVSGTKLTI